MVAEERALSVTEAMALAKRALETIRVRVVGEVSEFNDKPGYKAAYFTICDGSASMPCLMWRDDYMASGVTLRCGMLVEMSGQFSAFPAKGRLQFTVRSLDLAGEGRLRMQVAELARRLETEGLMRPDRKRSLATYPERIAVVTSPRGKAVHDVLRTLRRRYPLAEVVVAGVPVEGETAADSIVEGLRVAAEATPDVILLVRGGGSYEDLMPFNAEKVARAVAASPVPVVTGIGHEPDNSIADMVADLRASTPTAAAEAVAPSLAEMSARLGKERRAIANALERVVSHLSYRVSHIAARPVLRDPTALLFSAGLRIDDARGRLERALPERLARDITAVQRVRVRLSAVGTQVIDAAAGDIRVAAARMEALSPLKVLGRGYAAAFRSDGRTVVSSVGQVNAGDALLLRVSDGTIGCSVTGTERGGIDE
jgi:exodeoxyribonuclease VII large subunit